MKFFDDIKIGDKTEFEIEISEELHKNFEKISGDSSSIHTDDHFSKIKGFKEKIGYAFLLNSFLSKLYGEHLPGGSSICLKQESKFIKPFYIGDKLILKAEVISKSETTKILEIKTEIFNQEKERIFEGTGLVQVIAEQKDFPIYLTKENKKIYPQDIEKSIESTDIKKGDTIFVHSDIMSFGKIGSIKNKEEFLKILINIFREVVGEDGTIIMPTFTYSYCKKEIFDPLKTPSTVGILTEYFRKMPNVKRSKDAIFSIAASGPEEDYFTQTGQDCFGESSVFEKLYQKDAKIVFFGKTFDMTYLHFIEQKIGSPYRFIKEFPGKTKLNGELKDFISRYNVRHLDINTEYDFDKISNHLKQKGFLKEEALGNSKIRVVGAVDTFNELRGEMKKDPYFLLKNPPTSI